MHKVTEEGEGGGQGIFSAHFLCAVPENSFIRKIVMLQFPSLPNGIVKNCYYSQKLAQRKEEVGEREREREREREQLLSFTANSGSKKFQRGPLLQEELKLGLQRGKHQRGCTFA